MGTVGEGWRDEKGESGGGAGDEVLSVSCTHQSLHEYKRRDRIGRDGVKKLGSVDCPQPSREEGRRGKRCEDESRRLVRRKSEGKCSHLADHELSAERSSGWRLSSSALAHKGSHVGLVRAATAGSKARPEGAKRDRKEQRAECAACPRFEPLMDTPGGRPLPRKE